MRTITVLLGISAALTACSGSRAPADAPPEVNRGTVLIDTADESVLMHVLVSETEEQRAVALERAAALPPDEGIVFLYFEPTSELFVAAGPRTLSVAFFDRAGEILEILDVGPCGGAGETCVSAADPGVDYVGALAVDEGAFERLDVEEGDVVEVVPGSE